MFGITDEEFASIKESNSDAEKLIKQHSVNNPLLITDLERENVEIQKDELSNVNKDNPPKKQTTIEPSKTISAPFWKRIKKIIKK